MRSISKVALFFNLDALGPAIKKNSGVKVDTGVKGLLEGLKKKNVIKINHSRNDKMKT